MFVIQGNSMSGSLSGEQVRARHGAGTHQLLCRPSLGLPIRYRPPSLHHSSSMPDFTIQSSIPENDILFLSFFLSSHCLEIVALALSSLHLLFKWLLKMSLNYPKKHLTTWRFVLVWKLIICYQEYHLAYHKLTPCGHRLSFQTFFLYQGCLSLTILTNVSKYPRF